MAWGASLQLVGHLYQSDLSLREPVTHPFSASPPPQAAAGNSKVVFFAGACVAGA